MTEPVTIVLLGQPVAWARAGSKGGQRFTPHKQRNNAAALRLAAQQIMDQMGQAPFTGAVSIEILAEMKIPASWSRKKQYAAIIGTLKHTSKPDIDRLVNQVFDAIGGGIVYNDDRQIDDLRTRKRYGLQPKIVITVSENYAEVGLACSAS